MESVPWVTEPKGRWLVLWCRMECSATAQGSLSTLCCQHRIVDAAVPQSCPGSAPEPIAGTDLYKGVLSWTRELCPMPLPFPVAFKKDENALFLRSRLYI